MEINRARRITFTRSGLFYTQDSRPPEIPSAQLYNSDPSRPVRPRPRKFPRQSPIPSPRPNGRHGSIWTVRSVLLPPTTPAIPLLPASPSLSAPSWLILPQSLYHPPPDKLPPSGKLQIRSLSPPLLSRLLLPPILPTPLAESTHLERGPCPETATLRQTGIPLHFAQRTPRAKRFPIRLVQT